MSIQKNWFKLLIGFVVCFLIRLIPFRPPNIEPLLGTQMPFAKTFGPWVGFIFAFTSIVFFDFFTGHTGIWTLITASTYGILGLFTGIYLKNRPNQTKTYVTTAIMGTLFYDAVTGLTIGPLFFHQSFMTALVGQIPFTGLHLFGNILFAIILSPLVYKFAILNKRFESSRIQAFLIAKQV